VGRFRFLVAAMAVAALAALGALATAAGPSPLGSVKQLAGKKGCYTRLGGSQMGPGTCTDIIGGDEATDLALSPDGRFAYMVGYGVSTPVLSIFRRDPADGTLKQLGGKKGCLSSDGSADGEMAQCTNARDIGTGDGHSLAISSDGRFLYDASQTSPFGGLSIFKRNLETGTLRQLKGKQGCITFDGSSEDGPATCAQGPELDDTSSVSFSPDEHYLYATNYDSSPAGGIAIFKRSAKSGTLHQLKGKAGCITQDGTTSQSAIPVCRAASGVGEPFEVLQIGRFVYAANSGDDLVATLKQDQKGGLAQLPGKAGCISDTGDSAAGANTCRVGHGLYDAERFVPSKGNRFLYVNGFSGPTNVAVLDRNPKTGTLSERSGTAACISEDGGEGNLGPGICRNGRALNGGYVGSLSPDGRTLYYGTRDDNSFVVLRTNPKTGAFSQLDGKFGCVSVAGASEEGPGTCAVGRAVNHVWGALIAPNGRDLYVVGGNDAQSNGVALFHAKRK